MSENTTPRFSAALATYTEHDGSAAGPYWGVVDGETKGFAAFGPNATLAFIEGIVLPTMERNPNGWDLVPEGEYTVAGENDGRVVWAGASYVEADGESYIAYGAVDTEKGVFYPFSTNDNDPDGQSFVADVVAFPGKYSGTSHFTRL